MHLRTEFFAPETVTSPASGAPLRTTMRRDIRKVWCPVVASGERVVVLDDAQLAEVLAPRTFVVTEVEDAPGVFSATDGPVRSYRRTVTFTTETDGRHRVSQRVEMQPNIPFWSWLFG